MKIKYSSIVIVSFLLLCFIIFANLNGILNLTFNVVAIVSPIILLLSMIIIYISFFHLRVSFRDNKLLWIISFYIFYLFISTCSLLWSDYYLSRGIKLFTLYRSYLSSIIIILSFYFGAKVVLREKGKKYLMVVIVSFLTISTIATVFGEKLGLYESFAYMQESQKGERSAGFFGNPNEAGAVANYSLVVFLTCFMIMKRKWLFLILSGLAISGSILSFSKAAFILTLFILLLFIFINVRYFLRQTSKTRSYFVGIFAIIIMLSIINFSNPISSFELTHAQQTRITTVFALLSGEINSQTTSDRTIVYKDALELIEKSPIRGHGLGTFHRLKYGMSGLGVHNTYLLIFGESGIIPILLFIGFYLMLLSSTIFLNDVSLTFFIIGVISIYMLGVAGTGHNALDDRTSNALVAIILAILNLRKDNVRISRIY